MPNNADEATNPEAFFCDCTVDVVFLYLSNGSLKLTVQMSSLVAVITKGKRFLVKA